MDAKDFRNDKWLVVLIQRIEKPLKSSLLRMLTKEDVDDVLQETYLRVFLKRDDNQIRDFDGYAFRIARNIAIDKIRGQDHQARHVAAHEHDLRLVQESAGENADTIESTQILNNAINGLPPKCRDILIARKIHGFSHFEIAQQFQISRKTVEAHLTKALKQLRTAMLHTQADESEERQQ